MTLTLDDLKESNEFLNSLIDNINSGIFLVDGEIRIREFNRALEILFGRSEQELIGELCGNALGCAFAVNEGALCGKTSNCAKCELRGSIMKSLVKKETTVRRRLTREFYIHDRFILKHMEFSTKNIHFRSQEMILLIVDDITESENRKLELIEKQKRIDKDLKAAAGIQQSLLPRGMPHFDRVEIGWRFMPCEVIGGDIFDVFRLDDERLGFYMLDVSGHGVPSALVTVSISQVFQSLVASNVTSPRAVCEALDGEYPFERFGTFVTMVYAVINVRDGSLVYSSAGHPPMVLIPKNGELEFLSTGGSVIGLGGLVPFAEGRVQLHEGDKIVAYTDGVTEYRNARRDLYGRTRFCERLKELRDRPIDSLLSEVVESVLEFGAGEKLRDDLTLLAMEYRTTD